MNNLDDPSKRLTADRAERLYALDALRATMMLLGIVFHTALTYSWTDMQGGWPIKDPDNSFVFDIMAAYIHTFRMPVFFVVSGFFAALLFLRRGPRAMMINRFNRILLPLIAASLFIFPLIEFASTAAKASFQGDPHALNKAASELISGKIFPFRFAHLWFLYYLIHYSVAAFLLGLLLDKSTQLTRSANVIIDQVINSYWLRILAMITFSFVCLYWMGTAYIKTTTGFSIDPATWTLYFLFFGTGWAMYSSNCLNQMRVAPLWQLGIATLLFLVAILAPWPDARWVLHARQALLAIYGTLFVFGFLALFLIYFGTFSKRLAYLMDASYWVYIIHLPIAIFIPSLMAGLELSAFVKFSISLTVTTLLCFFSYHYAVRGTFIGLFLNGKVHKRKAVGADSQGRD